MANFSLRTLLRVRRSRPSLRSLGVRSLRAWMLRTFGQLGGFLPSTHGLHYSNNSWPEVPDRIIPTPFGDIPIGNASDGLCGGMAFAVADLFEAGRSPPLLSRNPVPNSPAFNFIVDRLFDSFNLPGGVVQYFQWMNLPRHDTLVARGLSWRTIIENMPRVQASLDAGHPCPLGLVCVSSANPADLGKNHQVLAWACEEEGETTIVRVYDPNRPDGDDIAITFSHVDPTHTTGFHYSGGKTVLGFFVVDYSPRDPSPLFEDRHPTPSP